MKPYNEQEGKSQKSLYLKIGFILVLILLLMIPNFLIQDLIRERQSLDYEVKNEIASNWGPSQHIIGPILSIPYTVEIEFDKKKKLIQHTLRVVPEDIDIDVDLNTEERKKGIYKAILYNAVHKINGTFKLPDLKDFGNYVKEVHWDRALIDIGFSSAASLDEIVKIKWNNDTYKMESGASDPSLFSSGIHTNVNIDTLKDEYNFSTNMA